MFVPLTLPMIALMGIAPYISWKRTNKVSDAIPKWFVAAITSLVLATLGTSLLSNQYQQDFHWGAFTTLTVSIWLIVSTTLHILSKAKHQQGLLSGLKRLSVSYWAMVIAHMGIAVTAIGIGLTSVYEQQKDVRMLIGDDISVSGYRYQLTAINTFEGPNFSGTRGDITVFNNEDVVAVLQPEKRFYYAARNVMTEAAIDPSLTRDLYVALGEELGEGAWAVRVHVKPFVRCIWLGALMMALGGFLAVTDKRYRRKGALNA
jgi:cytochrome c-type biogenesis protein CcmF